jgi:formiminoglutamase
MGKDVWQGRVDNDQKERFHQVVEFINPKDLSKRSFPKNTIAFIGFACDVGVKRNHGRVGAKEGPDALRKALSNYPLHDNARNTIFIDLGNVISKGKALEASQKNLADLIREVVAKKIFPIVLGGGHETAWGHYQGLTAALQDPNFAIVNVDAHFDMRPLSKKGEGSSGTPFLQIAEDRKKHQLPFHYYCIGIQKSANTASLFDTAKQWDVRYITCEEIHDFPHQLDQLIKEVIAKHDKIYLTLCLDAFSSSVAPGVSAVSPNGLLPSQVIPSIRKLAQSGKVIGLDIVELAPRLDHHEMTAKLGAFCLVEFIYQLRAKHE